MSDYYGDVSYQVWRSGHSPDDIDHDLVRGYESDGYRPDEAANAMVRSWDQARQRRMEAQQEEEAMYQQQERYPEQEQPEQPCMSESCAAGNCDGCTDVDANCCECNCHLRMA